VLKNIMFMAIWALVFGILFYHFKKISSSRLPWPDNGYMLIKSPICAYTKR